jgi:hypothetical protein
MVVHLRDEKNVVLACSCLCPTRTSLEPNLSCDATTNSDLQGRCRAWWTVTLWWWSQIAYQYSLTQFFVQFKFSYGRSIPSCVKSDRKRDASRLDGHLNKKREMETNQMSISICENIYKSDVKVIFCFKEILYLLVFPLFILPSVFPGFFLF